MILLGLPNESIEYDPIFGEVLVSLDDLTPVVTFIWSSKAAKNNPPLVYTVLSTVYDSGLLENRLRCSWVSTIQMGDRFHDPSKCIITHVSDAMVAQAVAYQHIEQLKGKTHDNERNTSAAA
jgi:hypothetical protein